MKVASHDFFDIHLPKDGEHNENEMAENLEAYQQYMLSDYGKLQMLWTVITILC